MSRGSTPISSGTWTAGLPGESRTGDFLTPPKRRAFVLAPPPSSRLSAVSGNTGTPTEPAPRARRARVPIRVTAAPRHEHGLHGLTQLGMVDADDRALLDIRMVLDALLDLDRVHVLAAPEDQVALARRQVEPAALHPSDVAGAQPPPGRDRLRGR